MRLAQFIALLLAGCQQAATPANNSAANAVAEPLPAIEAETNAAVPEAAPKSTRIPAKFRGIWAEGRAACAQLSHPSRLIISESVIRYPSFVLVGESFDLSTDAGIAIAGHNQRTGAPAEAHYSIDAAGLVLTDEAGGGAVRVKCG